MAQAILGRTRTLQNADACISGDYYFGIWKNRKIIFKNKLFRQGHMQLWDSDQNGGTSLKSRHFLV